MFRLNRPDKMNALDPAMFPRDRRSRCTHRGARPQASVPWCCPARGARSAPGLDVERMDSGGLTRRCDPCRLPDSASRTHGIANFAQHVVWLWRELPMPVIAAVHGVAFGGGFQLALGADLRYVAPGTRLAVIETKWGLVPDMAGTQLMRHLANEDVVRELTYTARTFSAEQALAYGFATEVSVKSIGGGVVDRPRDRKPEPRRYPGGKAAVNLAVGCDAATGLRRKPPSRPRFSANKSRRGRQGQSRKPSAT